MIIDESIAYSKLVPEKQTKASVNSFGGKTVVRNQLVQNGNFEDTSFWSASNNRGTISASENVMTYTITEVGTAYNHNRVQQSSKTSKNHIYLCLGEFLTQNGELVAVSPQGNAGSDSNFTLTVAGEWTKYQKIVTKTNTDSLMAVAVDCRNSLVGGTWSVRKCHLIDLTQMFGSGNEPTAVSDYRIQMLEAFLDANPSYYNTGELVSAEVQNVVSVGKNVFNPNTTPSVTSGVVNYENGQLSFSPSETITTQIALFPINLKENKIYSISFTAWSNIASSKITFDGQPDSVTGYLSFNDIQFELTTTPTRYTLNNQTAPFGMTGLRFFRTPTSAGTTTASVFIKDIQIELGSTATPYSPYFSNSKPIPSALLTFLTDKGYGWSAGTVYNEIDFVNKKYIKRVGNADLGTLTWNTRDIAGSLGFSTAELGSPISAVITAKYPSVYSISMSAMTADKTLYYGHLSLGVVIKDSAYSDVASFKSAMNGVMLYYELATPVEYDISSYLDDDFIIDVEAGGTVSFEQQSGGLNLPIYSKVIFLSSVESLQTLQEEHLSDLTLREQFMAYWNAGQFSQAYAILQNSQFDDKAVKAETFNELTDGIYDLETQSDPTFKQYRIVVSDTPPADLDVGKIYFQTV